MVYVFRINLTYLWNEAFTSLNKTFSLLTSLVIFTYIQPEPGNIINYLILGNIFLATTEAQVAWFIGNSIKDGKISRYLILPQNFLKFLFFNAFSNVFYMLITYSVSLLPIVLLFWDKLVFSWAVGWLFLLWPLVVLIRLGLEQLIGFVAFWTTEFYGIVYLSNTLTTFLSGSLFPLYFISEKYPIFEYTPFALMFYHPMQIYLGKYNLNQILMVFAGGFFWSVFLFLASKIMFKLGLKKNESVGL